MFITSVIIFHPDFHTTQSSALLCDDTEFMDNISHYTEGQDGLFHVKLSHTCMLVNEY